MTARTGDTGASAFTRIVKTGSVVLLILIVASALFFFTVPFLGWKTEIVLSGSMEPSIPTGSVVVTRPVRGPSTWAMSSSTPSSPGGADNAPGSKDRFRYRVEFHHQGRRKQGSGPEPVSPVQVAGIVAFDIPYAGTHRIHQDSARAPGLPGHSRGNSPGGGVDPSLEDPGLISGKIDHDEQPHRYHRVDHCGISLHGFLPRYNRERPGIHLFKAEYHQ